MIKVGRFEIAPVEEIVVDEPSSLFPDWDPAVLEEVGAWYDEAYYDADRDVFFSTIQSWLVRDGATTMLIDTCSGNAKPRSAFPRFDRLDEPYLERLAQAGASPEDIDLVILTHLHVDHVGWNTRLVDGRWRATFPNATYVMTGIERDARDPERGAASAPPERTVPFQDSIRPILDGEALVDIVRGDEADYRPGVSFQPVPGHAPGMMAVRLEDQGQQALFVADVIHQPIQALRPEWSSKYCEDKPLAVDTRRRVLEQAAETGCLVLPSHFGGSHCGYVRRDGAGYVWEPRPLGP